MRSQNAMKFANAASARTHGTALYAAGKVFAWCEYRSGKNYILRVIRRAGGGWETLV